MSRFKRVGRIESQIRDYDRPTRMTVHDEARGMSGDFEFLCSPEDGGTRLVIDIRMHPRGPMRLMQPLLRPMMIKQCTGSPGR